MSRLSMVSAQAWAEQTFAQAELGDQRRTDRLVRVATRMAEAPGASFPLQMGGKIAELKATYRLLHEEDVTHEALSRPHWEQTRKQAAGQEQPVLLIHDDTELDYGYDPAVKGLGPVGNGTHRGFYVHSVLAVVPQGTRERVLGLAGQVPWVRKPAPRTATGKKQSSRQRAQRPRESEHWTEAIEQVGRPPAGACWIHVGDGYADMYAFLRTALALGGQVLVRVWQNRRILDPEGEHAATAEVKHLIAEMTSWPAQDSREHWVPSEHERRARRTRLCISWGPVRIPPTDLHGQVSPDAPVLELWGIHVWEPEPPLRSEGQRPRVPKRKHTRRSGKQARTTQAPAQPSPSVEEERMEPLEWFLLCSLPIRTAAEAWRGADWYGCRWSVEDFHKGIKTGCRLEARRLRDQASLQRYLALASTMAVRLVQLRELIWEIPEEPVLGWVERDEAQVIAWQEQVPLDQLRMGHFVRTVARMGGFVGRRSDGDPGWQTLWKGWERLQWKVEGLRLAREHSPP